MLVVTKSGNTFVAAPAQVQVNTKEADAIPDVGEPAPRTRDRHAGVGRRATRSCSTRASPPSDMHADSFDEVVGKKPVALLFSTPQLCQSRVCGPVTDVALQLKAKYGDQMEFIHQEVYVDNDPQQGPAAAAAGASSCATEPWLFVVGARRARSPRGSRARSASRPSRDALKTAL